MVKVIENNLTLSGSEFADLAGSLFARNAFVRIRAEGFSMYPFIRNGATITLGPLKEGDPTIGDVVAVVQNETDTMLIHRVIKKRGNTISLKGDNCERQDGTYPKEKILGKLTKTWHTTTPLKHLIAHLSRHNLLGSGLAL